VSEKKQILLTNDDGIHSPGLWAAAGALEALGYVTVAAPREQSTAAGRSMPLHSEGRIHEETLTINGRAWQAYAIDGAPAQVVQHTLLELLPDKPDLVVSGINYGENVGSGVTISGTVGAALEAASFGLPSLAVSLETEREFHYTHSADIDFSTAAFFTQKFACLLLGLCLPFDVDVLKVEVPAGATPETPWRVARLSRTRYYLPIKPQRENLKDKANIDYRRVVEPHGLEPDSDVRALVDQVVSVTPLSLDMTSRIDLGELARLMEQGGLGP